MELLFSRELYAADAAGSQLDPAVASFPRRGGMAMPEGELCSLGAFFPGKEPRRA